MRLRHRYFEENKLELSFSFNSDLYRFATKMAAGVAVFSGNPMMVSKSGIPAYLHGNGEWPTNIAYCDVSAVRQLRRPLTHTVYLEFGQLSFAIVLLFGSQKIFVPFPSTAGRMGVLATLYPLTGEEAFSELSPLGPPSLLSDFNKAGQRDVVLAHIRDMSRDACGRGCPAGGQVTTKLRTEACRYKWWTQSVVEPALPESNSSSTAASDHPKAKPADGGNGERPDLRGFPLPSRQVDNAGQAVPHRRPRGGKTQIQLLDVPGVSGQEDGKRPIRAVGGCDNPGYMEIGERVRVIKVPD